MKKLKIIALVTALLVGVSQITAFASTDSDAVKWAKEHLARVKYEDELRSELKCSIPHCRWLNKDNNWYYFGDVGNLETGWFSTIFYIDDQENIVKDVNTYYADELGRIQTGWVQDSFDNKWYYLSESGALLKNTTTPDGYQVDESGAMIENNENRQERKKTIEIFGIWCSTNSVGGVSPKVCWRNGTGKIIKYITFDMVPYNAVGDRQSCGITGYSDFSGYVTGPIEPEGEVGDYLATSRASYTIVLDDGLGRPYSTQNHEDVAYSQDEINRTFSQIDAWDCAWYNSSIKEIRITGIRVDYMDGSSQTFNPTDAYYWK